jgi:hypothetical protein
MDLSRMQCTLFFKVHCRQRQAGDMQASGSATADNFRQLADKKGDSRRLPPFPCLSSR